MLKRLIIFLASVVILAATHARALGLGDITLDSALNQPLSARIELLQTRGVRMDDIRVQMAASADFERFSLDRPYYLDSIRFRVREGDAPGQPAYIELVSNNPLREPYLSFVLDTRWSRGRVLAEYTVLLDPPSFASAGAVQSPQPPVSLRYETPADAGLEEEPGAPVPDDSADTLSSSVTAESEPVSQDVQQSSTPSSPAPRFADASDTVEVDGDDTLWDIALNVRPDDSVSVQQTMLALQRRNPEAFINGNINLIRRGAVLRIPDPEALARLGGAEAVAEVSRQNRLFEDRRNVPLGAEPLTSPPSEDSEASSGDGELSIVTTDDSDTDNNIPANADAAAGERFRELDQRIEALEDQLAVSREEVDRVERENRELNERLAMLEEQIESATEILRLRDLELARLQESVSDEGPLPRQTGNDDTQESGASQPDVEMAPQAPLPQRILGILSGNPVILGAILALVVALLVLVLIRRNRAEQEALIDEQRQRDEEDELDFSRVAVTAADQEVSGEEADSPSARETTEAGSPQPVAGATPTDEEFGQDQEPVAGATGAQQREELDDLMAEVDALIDHRQFEEARRLLENAIVAEPNREALRVRLLEVLAAQEDVDAFHLQETELGIPESPDLRERLEELRGQVAALEAATSTDVPDVDEELGRDEELELELDMESSAEVDDQKVLRGTMPDADADADADKEIARDTERTFEDGFSAQEEDDEFEFDFELDLNEDDHDHTEFSEAAEPTPEQGADELDETTESLTEETGDGFDISWEPLQTSGAMDDESAETNVAVPEETREAAASDTGSLDEFDFSRKTDESDPASGTAPVPEREPLELEQEPSSDRDREAGAEQKPEVSEPEEAEAGYASEEGDLDFSLDDFALDAELEERLDHQDTDSEDPRSWRAIHTDAGDEKDDRADDTNDGPFMDTNSDETMVGEPEEPAAAPSVEQDEDDGFDFLDGADEAATKLDLARAYIDMGDHEGAREILAEVIEEGSETQSSDARQLIERLD